jgi:hypothetical protein
MAKRHSADKEQKKQNPGKKPKGKTGKAQDDLEKVTQG